MANLVFSPAAQQDLLDIFDFIAKDESLAAANRVDTMEQKCLLIAETPAFGELRPEFGSSIRSSVVG